MAALSLVISFPVAFLAAHVEQLGVTRWRSDSFPTCWKNTPHMYGRCSWKRALNKRYPKLYPWELDKMFFFLKNYGQNNPNFFFSFSCLRLFTCLSTSLGIKGVFQPQNWQHEAGPNLPVQTFTDRQHFSVSTNHCRLALPSLQHVAEGKATLEKTPPLPEGAANSRNLFL